MLYAGLDLSRKRLDVCPLDRGGERVWVGAAPPDRDGLAALARRVDAPVMAVIESMTGARFVHDGAGDAARHPLYKPAREQTKQRVGRQRGPADRD